MKSVRVLFALVGLLALPLVAAAAGESEVTERSEAISKFPPVVSLL